MYSETASLHLSILLHYYYFNPYMNPVLKLQPRSNSAIPFQIQEKTIAEASFNRLTPRENVFSAKADNSAARPERQSPIHRHSRTVP